MSQNAAHLQVQVPGFSSQFSKAFNASNASTIWIYGPEGK